MLEAAGEVHQIHNFRSVALGAAACAWHAACGLGLACGAAAPPPLRRLWLLLLAGLLSLLLPLLAGLLSLLLLLAGLLSLLLLLLAGLLSLLLPLLAGLLSLLLLLAGLLSLLLLLLAGLLSLLLLLLLLPLLLPLLLLHLTPIITPIITPGLPQRLSGRLRVPRRPPHGLRGGLPLLHSLFFELPLLLVLQAHLLPFWAQAVFALAAPRPPHGSGAAAAQAACSGAALGLRAVLHALQRSCRSAPGLRRQAFGLDRRAAAQRGRFKPRERDRELPVGGDARKTKAWACWPSARSAAAPPPGATCRRACPNVLPSTLQQHWRYKGARSHRHTGRQ